MSVCIPDLEVIWPPSTTLPPEPVDPDSPTPEEAEAWLPFEIALEIAWTSMQTLTAYQIALCPIIVRPCKKGCTSGTYQVAPVTWGSGSGASFYPRNDGGQWTNVWCGHAGDCSCTGISEVLLPGPVGAVSEVMIDGDVIDPTAYRIDNGNRLVRQDGGEWPLCQNMGLPAGEVGTFTVTFYRGAVADRTVLWAVGLLASELVKAINEDETCRLPAGTTAVVRQGLTIEVENNLFDDGTTGIPEIDAVVARFNPFHQKMPSRFWSVDVPKPRQTTYGG